MEKIVYLLGAGFSKAVNPIMPLTRELNQRVRQYDLSWMNSEVNPLLDEDFEKALSYLADHKPWMDQSDQLKHQVLLEDLSRNIGYTIRQAQRPILNEIHTERYSWLLPLVDSWDRSQATVITLNYDLIVEALAVAALGGPYPSGEMTTCQRLYPKVLAPSSVRSGLGSLADYAMGTKTFKLLKLHGSVNWHYSGRLDNQGEIIYFTAPSSVPEEPMGDGPEEVADKIPFIVPPLTSKGNLASHESIRAMWRQAANALQHATKLTIMGYSMPSSDILLTQMVRTKFPDFQKIEVVDQNEGHGKAVAASLRRAEENVHHSYSGANCIRDFVARLPTPKSEIIRNRAVQLDGPQAPEPRSPP